MSVNRSISRLGIIDNDPMALAALSSYIRKRVPVSSLWTASDSNGGLELHLRQNADVLLVDMSMPDMDGPSLIRNIRQRDGKTVIIAMTSFPVSEYAQDAADAGAQAIASKRYPTHIIEVLRSAARGEAVISHDTTVPFDTAQAAHRRILAARPTGFEQLTHLERDILEYCRQGFTSSQIGRMIDMNAATVNTHLKRACCKVGARNRVHLVALWLQHNPPRR
ncbi:two-component response regulator [Bifidobacterium eulemuris]|nr:two-component response regulator [Bifidobacterium eulemuris]